METIFSMLRLGTQAFFEGRTRDFITSEEFIIRTFGATDHFEIEHKVSGKKHFIPMHNVSYAEFKSEPKSGGIPTELMMSYDQLKEVEKHFQQNDSVKESPHEDSARESGDPRENQNTPVISVKEKSKKSKKN